MLLGFLHSYFHCIKIYGYYFWNSDNVITNDTRIGKSYNWLLDPASAFGKPKLSANELHGLEVEE